MCGSDVQSNSEAMVKLCDEKMEMSNWAVCNQERRNVEPGGAFYGKECEAGRALFG